MSVIHFDPVAAIWLISLPWWGKALLVIQERSGAAYVPLERICEMACVRPQSPSHLQRVLAHPHLSTALRVFVLFDGEPHWCVRVEAVQSWLVTIHSRSLRPELRAAVQVLRQQTRDDLQTPLALPAPTPRLAASAAGAALWTLDEALRQ